ncbi:hypothetical protein [Vibrio sp. 03_296]|uniref:hypothetical protein n=1 Tax=Vibrio sp. 03_296 TaxID=2024409 RepID=UPI002D80B208|nr:hypothetical protein [Vibrio sp. 03_296]
MCCKCWKMVLSIFCLRVTTKAWINATFWSPEPYDQYHCLMMVESTADYQERNLAILDRTGNYYSYLDVNPKLSKMCVCSVS